jgi:hypothetical protein
MTKVLRTLAGAAVVAVLGALLLGFNGVFGATDVEAQAPPARPARFAGSVLVDGAPVPAGTTIEARINGNSCGVDATFTEGGQARYVIDVQATEPNADVECGSEDAVVSFYIGGKLAAETGLWRDYDLNIVNLTYTTPTPTGTASATPSGTATTPTGGATTPAGGATGTPKPPPTGSGTATEESGMLVLFAILGAGALAFGAGGYAVTRRGR